MRCRPSGERGAFSGLSVSGVATLDEAKPGDLSFISSAKFKAQFAKSQASVLFVPPGLELEPGEGQLFLEVKNPSWALSLICADIEKAQRLKKPSGVHSSAVVEEGAVVDATASIGPFVLVEAGAKVGADCEIGAGSVVSSSSELGAGSVLHSRVTLVGNVRIGNRVTIHSGSVIGADGFAYEFAEGRHQKVPQIGSVEIGDDVEIGANTTIDRGRVGPTIVGAGTKIDNQVQVGHNTRIGKHCILCAQVGIAGSTIIEDYAVFGGRAGASGHIRIGKGAQLAGCAVAFSDLEGGAKYGGVPAIPLNAYMRISAISRKLPELLKRLRSIEGGSEQSL